MSIWIRLTAASSAIWVTPGLAIQAVAPLYVNQQVFLRFDLANPRARIEATGRVAWADPVGQAGVEFVLLSPRSRRLLKEWILIQLLASAQNSAGDAAFFHNHSGQQAHGAVVLLGGAAGNPSGTGKGGRATKRELRQSARHLASLVSVCHFGACAFAAGRWTDPAFGGTAVRADLHRHGGGGSGLARRTGHGIGSGCRFRGTLSFPVFILDREHAGRLAGGNQRQRIREK